jgi:hypothetical protein
MRDSYQVLPPEGDVSKQSLLTREGTAQSSVPAYSRIHSIRRTNGNREAPEACETLSLGNKITEYGILHSFSYTSSLLLNPG